MHPHDKRLQFIELRSKGWSIYRISETIDVPKSTLCDWQKQDKARIEELKEMEQEALEEQLTEQREHEYQKLSSRLDLVERALDQQLQEKIGTLSLMELCRLSSALRSQIGKLGRRTQPGAPRSEGLFLPARCQLGGSPSAGHDHAQQQRGQEEEPLQTNKMVLFGTASPENVTAPQPCEPCSEEFFLPARRQRGSIPPAGCDQAQQQRRQEKEPLQEGTGQNRTEPSDPGVRKDPLPPQPTETAQKEAPPTQADLPAAPMATDSPSLTQPNPPATPPAIVAPAPSRPAPPSLPDRVIGGIIDPNRIIGRRCSTTTTHGTKK